MSSIIEGYNYDIFISYRQKDNKRDGWVTEFIENLKGELESTFKEEISVYFDINPHDGLLETHDVGASLKEKLKCLIFIPVISRTYCDPNSFAWQYELKAFIDLASNDQFGLKIRIPGGNIAGRILPIIIHELDPEDRKILETELGGFIRGIDFIYEEQGVNRPLMANEDHPDRNLHKVFYRNQVNKTANAIKDILSGIKTLLKQETAGNLKHDTKLEKPSEPLNLPLPEKRKSFIIFGSILLAAALITFLVTGIFAGKKQNINKDPDGRISIAVNNFDNLTGDTTLNSWAAGIAELLIYNLGNSQEIGVQNSRTMNELYSSMGQSGKSRISAEVSRDVARKLRAGNYITGNFQKAGNSIRLMAKLSDTESNNILWTQKVDGDINKGYITLADSLAGFLKDFLEIKALEKKTMLDFQNSFTKSADAYRKYIDGTRIFMDEDYQGAIKLFHEAFSLDSTFALAAFYIANANNIIAASNSNPEFNLQAIKWTQKAHELRANLPPDYQNWIDMWYSYYMTRNSDDVLKYCGLLERSNIKSRYYWYDIAVTYLSSFRMWQKAADAFAKIETINQEWDEDWKFSNFYRYYGVALHQLGNHEKEAEIYEKGISLFPDFRDNGWLLNGMALCSLSGGKTEQGKATLERIIEHAREDGTSERNIERYQGGLFMDAGLLDEAEQHLRTAMRMYSNDAWSMHLLANLLIKYDRGVDEGLSLIEKALAMDPVNPFYLQCKGIGLFKKEKFKESLEYLENAKNNFDSVRPDLDKDIQKVKDAINSRL